MSPYDMPFGVVPMIHEPKPHGPIEGLEDFYTAVDEAMRIANDNWGVSSVRKDGTVTHITLDNNCT